VSVVDLSAAQARSLSLDAQGLLGAPFGLRAAAASRAKPATRLRAMNDVIDRLGAVQLDTISTLARNHELVAYARLGPIGREAIETAYWGAGRDRDHPDEPTTFEYWSHAASILPIEVWPWFSFRRRHFRRRGIRWHDVPHARLDAVRDRLRVDGPLTAGDLGGAKKGGVWWDWSDTKIAVEWLLDVGEVVCVRRIGWRRVYDLAERAIPETARPTDVDVDGVVGPSDAACIRELLRRSMIVLGVGTRADLNDVHRLKGKDHESPLVAAALSELEESGEFVRVNVEGWDKPAWASAAALARGATGRSRTTLLSPFDSLVWDRPRTSRLFDFDHRLEAYVPAPKRIHGYFTMPVLHGGSLVSRVDPGRDGSAMVAKKTTFELTAKGEVPASAIAGTAQALAEAARWVGATSVRIDDVVPKSAVAPLRGAVAELQPVGS